MCLPNFMKFHHCLFKILKNQNVAAGGRTDMKTVPVRCGGGGGGGGGGYKNVNAVYLRGLRITRS